ncbi:MAG: hypothetical protein WBL86_27375, partial [Pseudolabrys sp.]
IEERCCQTTVRQLAFYAHEFFGARRKFYCMSSGRPLDALRAELESESLFQEPQHEPARTNIKAASAAN